MNGRVSREQLAFSFDEPTAAPPYAVVCDDVLRWAETYTGPKFHAMLCDPPYHLTEVTLYRAGGRMRNVTARTEEEQAARRGFMGQSWDGGDIAFKPETWKALAQHLLPGAFILAFGSSRGWHRLACAMEDAGLRIYPSIFGWASGSSFPKASRIDTKLDAAGVNYPSLHTLQAAIRQAREAKGMTRAEVSSAVCGTPSGACWNWESGLRVPTKDHWEQLQAVLNLPSALAETRAAAEREVIGDGIYAARRPRAGAGTTIHMPAASPETAPATPLAQIWAGHRYGGQVLKNSLEPIIVAQVPYAGKPVESIVKHGSGAMWIDGSRVGVGEQWWERGDAPPDEATALMQGVHGRWPPNFALQHHPECVAQGTRQVRGTHLTGQPSNGQPISSDDGVIYGPMAYRIANDYTDANGMEEVPAYQCHESCVVRKLDLQAGEHTSRPGRTKPNGRQGNYLGMYDAEHDGPSYPGDSANASRFFATADWSLDVAERLAQADPAFYCAKASRGERDSGLNGQRNIHPTVKALKLTQWLATLLLPPAAYAPRRLLNVFSGSGSEGIGAMLAGWDEIVMVEQDQSYVDISTQRLAYWSTHRSTRCEVTYGP